MPNLTHSNSVPVERVKASQTELAELLAFAYSDGEHDADNLDHEVADRIILWLEGKTSAALARGLAETGMTVPKIARQLGIGNDAVRLALKKEE